MNLKYIKKIGKHNLMIDNDSLALIVEKQYDINSQLILATLQSNKNFTHVPHIYDFNIDILHKKITSFEEYIEGKSVQELLDECVYIKEADFLLYITNLLTTLTLLHEQSFLHKDIKPGNIVVNDSGAYLIDFDISRQFDTSKETDTSLIGTKGYASPEQYGFAQTTDKSDIYSLGITIQDMLNIVILNPKQYEYYSALAKSMTNIDSNMRPSAKQLLEKIKEDNNSNNFRYNKKKTNASNSNSTITSYSKDIYLESFKAMLTVNTLIPWVRTGKGLLFDILANGFFATMLTEIVHDTDYVSGYYPVITILSLLLVLIFMNIFINCVTIPFYKNFKPNRSFKVRTSVWWSLRTLDYLIYFWAYVQIYNILSIFK